LRFTCFTSTAIIGCADVGPFVEYTGEWKEDHRWGWGALTFAHGDVYEGEWVDDILEGNGRYSYKDKSFYQVDLIA